MPTMLTPRMRKALEAMRYECDYEDHHKGGDQNYILRSALPAGVGEKTLADLLRFGLIENGPSRWHRETGFRITAKGRASIS